jgi:tetratricopeptide (TPR) repeat protein
VERAKTLAELQESCVISTALSLVNPNAPWYVRFFHADKRELKQDHNVSSMKKLGIEEAMNLKLSQQINDYINKLIDIADSAVASIISETATSVESTEHDPQNLPVYDVLFALGFLDLGASTLIALRGDYEWATKMFSTALRISERLVGVGHIETTDAIFNLALTYDHQGKNVEAIELYKRALTIFESEPADRINRIKMATIVENVAKAYLSLGEYDGALTEFNKALKIREEVFGVDDINATDAIMGIGLVYKNQGRYYESIKQYRRAWRIKEQTLGTEHIDCADLIGNIGNIHYYQGKYDGAIKQYERALSLYATKASAIDFVNIANTTNNLACAFLRQGKHSKTTFQYALGIYEKVFGVDHINTADTINNIGIACQDQELAIEHYKRALRIRETAFGADHISTVSTLINLGSTCHSQRNYPEAISLLERALAIKERTFGVGDINTASLIMLLGSVYDSNGDHRAAITLYARASQITESRPNTTTTNNRSLNLRLNSPTSVSINALPADGEQREANGIPHSIDHNIRRTTTWIDPRIKVAALETLTRSEPMQLHNQEVSISDLDETLHETKQKLRSTPQGHPDRLMYLEKLGGTLQLRFERTRSLEDLNAAIEAKEQLLMLVPEDHSARPGTSYNLANSLQSRYEETRSLDDINSASKPANMPSC